MDHASHRDAGLPDEGFDVPREPLVLGLVLGSMAEGELARAMSLVHGSVSGLIHSMLTSPISLIVIGLTFLSLWQE